jgi:hypothetical protein
MRPWLGHPGDAFLHCAALTTGESAMDADGRNSAAQLSFFTAESHLFLQNEREQAMTRHFSSLAVALAAFPLAALAAEPATAPVQRPGSGAGPVPPYTPVRWNENYAYLRDASRRTDPFDSLKYIPLNEEGDWYLSLGGQARYRYEWFNETAFGAPAMDDTNGYHLLRVLAHADLHMGPNLRAFVQGVAAHADGRDPEERPLLDEDVADIHQAFGDLRIPLDGGSITIRGGRQSLIYGAQRLISPLDWTNTRRTFDGGKLSLSIGRDNTLDFFAVHPVIVDDVHLNSYTDDQAFYGLYHVLGLPNVIEGANTKLDLYALYLDRSSNSFTEGTADEERYTIGARFSTNPKPWDFDVEAAWQFGDFGSGNINAWMFAAEAGYTVAGCPTTPRLYLGFDVASGDDDPTDGNLETFNQLFPLGHAYFGYIDVIGRQNIVDLHPGLEMTLLADRPNVKKLSLRADYHLLWRYSSDDAVYNVAGGITRAPGGSGAKWVGSELDLLLNWQIERHLSAYLGYSRFFAGTFFDQTGPEEDIDFVYAAMQFTF